MSACGECDVTACSARSACHVDNVIVGATELSVVIVLSSQCSMLSSQFLVLSSRFSVLSSQCSVPGSWFSVPGSQFLVPGSRFSTTARQTHHCDAGNTSSQSPGSPGRSTEHAARYRARGGSGSESDQRRRRFHTEFRDKTRPATPSG
jgi:hypothetical protein